MTGDETNFNQEQRAAVDHRESALSVLAGAGAGKTKVLVARFVRHVIEDGWRPDEILTITYTRKAAAEMKRRIVRELQERERWTDAQIAETGPIQTIHGFCERLLRENALLAGVDPEFEVLDEFDHRVWLEEAIQAELAGDLASDPCVEALLYELAGRGEYQTARSLHSRLAGAIRTTIDALRGSGVTPSELDGRYRSVKAYELFISEVLAPELPEAIREEFRLSVEPLQVRLERLFNSAKLKKPTYIKIIPEDEYQRQLELTCGLMLLQTSVWRALERRMDREQRFDFAELEARAVRLVEKEPRCAARLRRQFRAVLIDEMQDVNPVQYRLLESMAIPVQMLVGDPQQSIFRFRQADVDLFVEKTVVLPKVEMRTNYRSEAGILRFVNHVFGQVWPSSYRPMEPGASEPEDSDDPFAAPSVFTGVEWWESRDFDLELVVHWTEQLLSEGVPHSDIAILSPANQEVVQISSALRARGIPTTAVSNYEEFYAELEIRDLANVLRSLSDPTDDLTLLALLRSPMVDLSDDAIVILAARARAEEATVSALLPTFVSPIESDAAKIESFLRWFLPMERTADRMSAWEVIADVFARTDYLPSMAKSPQPRQALANARKLLAVATQQPEMSPRQFADRIRDIQSMRHKEGNAPTTDESVGSVRVSTIHRAKGLEFPVVILAGTYHTPDTKQKEIEFDAKRGVVSTRFVGAPNFLHLYLAAKRKAGDHEERLRVLYVAMTRAQKRLCVMADPGAGDGTWARTIARLGGLGAQVPPGIFRRPRLSVVDGSSVD